MDLKIVDNYSKMSEMAANIVAGLMQSKKDAVLGLATGSTPEGMYARLVEMYRQGKIDFNSVVTFNLDEYVGLAPDHPQSYHQYMKKNLFDHVNIKPSNTSIPHCSGNDNPGEVCAEFETKIKQAGGIDLQVLGIGVNGHIGFNEPASHLRTTTHLVELAEETIKANSRFFESVDKVPRKAITMGMGSIMGAKKVLLLASGENKAEAVRDSFSGFISTETPASLLQLHRDVLVVVDQEAASLIKSSFL